MLAGDSVFMIRSAGRYLYSVSDGCYSIVKRS